MDAGCRSACNELLEVAGEVRLDHADQAAPQIDVLDLVERDDASLTYLEQRRPVERVEDVFGVERYSQSTGVWLSRLDGGERHGSRVEARDREIREKKPSDREIREKKTSEMMG